MEEHEVRRKKERKKEREKERERERERERYRKRVGKMKQQQMMGKRKKYNRNIGSG